jgi:hypothetical protein
MQSNLEEISCGTHAGKARVFFWPIFTLDRLRTNRETGRNTDRQTGRQAGTQAGNQRDRSTEAHRDRQGIDQERQTD